MKYRVYCRKSKSIASGILVSQDGKFYEQSIIGFSEAKGDYEVHLATNFTDCEGVLLYEKDWISMIDSSGKTLCVGEICITSLGVSYKDIRGSITPLSNAIMRYKLLGMADEGLTKAKEHQALVAKGER